MWAEMHREQLLTLLTGPSTKALPLRQVQMLDGYLPQTVTYLLTFGRLISARFCNRFVFLEKIGMSEVEKFTVPARRAALRASIWVP